MSTQKVYLIPTVIADNSEKNVINDQVRHVISQTEYYLVEEVRTARRYISKLKLGLVIDDLQFQVLNKKTPPEIIQRYFLQADGRNIGIISESGCPGIADPGAVAVAYAHQNGIQVVPLSGPSSILMALIASGFNGQSFTFHGYVPIDKKEREKKFKEMEANAIRLNQTQLFMDTPYRNQKVFEHLLKAMQPQTLLSVAKGITGAEEFIRTLTIAEWKKENINLHKVPTIFSLFA